MSNTPPELDRMVDAVLAYKPPMKKKKLKAIAKGSAKKKKKKLS
jgi:hypothetical protein